MSYQSNQPKRTHNGTELVQLSVSKQLHKIRNKIEDMNHIHAGAELELVYQGFCEIQQAHGHIPIKLDPTCSGCVLTFKKLLVNWFKLYDKGSLITKAKHGAVETKQLEPVKEEPKELPGMKPDTKRKPTNEDPEGDIPDEDEVETTTTTEEEKSDLSKMRVAELLKKFNAVATKKEKETINNGKDPKKAQIIEYFNKRENG